MTTNHAAAIVRWREQVDRGHAGASAVELAVSLDDFPAALDHAAALTRK